MPVVSAPVGGIPQTLQDKKTGFITLDGSPEALSRKLDYLLSHPDQLDKKGRAARVWAEKNLDWRVIAGRYAYFYNHVTEKFRQKDCKRKRDATA